MADLHDLDSLVADLLAGTVGDDAASERLQGALTAALGNAIAVRAAGDATVAALHCDRAGMQVIEAATFAALLLEDAGRP